MRGDDTIRIFETIDGKFFIARVAYYDSRIIEEVYMNLEDAILSDSYNMIVYSKEKKFMPLGEAANQAWSKDNGYQLMLYETFEKAKAAKDKIAGERQLIAIVLNAKPAEDQNQL